MCYIQSGLHFESPYHVSSLWTVKTPSAINLRQTGLSLEYTLSKKGWITKLAPTAQAKLWNNSTLDKSPKPQEFKTISKDHYLSLYDPEHEV